MMFFVCYVVGGGEGLKEQYVFWNIGVCNCGSSYCLVGRCCIVEIVKWLLFVCEIDQLCFDFDGCIFQCVVDDGQCNFVFVVGWDCSYGYLLEEVVCYVMYCFLVVVVIKVCLGGDWLGVVELLVECIYVMWFQ